uniref:RNA helicase n=1 Tax=Caenorhabditis tropicalis TaxID=1561998 RepID=A0A1I7UYT2_9PELO
MSDWGNAFDEQCRSEGLEVPEKTTRIPSNSEMNQNEENKGFNGGVGRGGMFGGGLKTNAPPPQTSFGATSGSRIGGSFGNTGPDGRGAAIGSPEELSGGGNVTSINLHKETPACTFTRGGGFGTNYKSALPSASIKTNHESGRFGVLATRNLDGNNIITSSELIVSAKPPVLGRFGAAQPSMSRSTVGGAFGSKSSANVTTPSFGGSFSGNNQNVTPGSSTSGSFSFSVKPATSVGGSFGSALQPAVIQKEESEGKLSIQKTNSSDNSDVRSVKTIGRGFGSRIGGAFNSSKSSSEGAIDSTQMPTTELVKIDYSIRSAEVELVNDKNSTHAFVSALNKVDQNKRCVESFGNSQLSAEMNKNPFGRPPFPIEREEKENHNCANGPEKLIENVDLHKQSSFGSGFDRNNEPISKPAIQSDNKEQLNASFMPTQSQRGGFQGGFRGGRGFGGGAGVGQMDFSAVSQGPMGRGRGQHVPSFVPQQRTLPPSFEVGNQTPHVVKPDPKYKYTKSTDDNHEKVPIPADIALLNKFIQKEVKMMKDTVVDVQRLDPKSPLYSISSFRELRLKPEVLQALDTLNFQFPTRIQETALPLLLMEPPSNLIAQAQSGTGKTAAFVLTMLCRIDTNLKYPQCICLAPTLELAKQIGEVVEKMGSYMENLKIHYAIKGGNMAAMRGRKLTEQIVIGTPASTRDYLQKYKCIDPSQIRCLVLDEADVMIYQQGFTDISTTIYNMVEEASDSVQSMLFSATYDEPVINFATKLIKNAIVVMLKREEQALPNIKQFYVQCACRDSKYAAIVNLYSGLAVASSVIFCHTKASVMWLYENMKARGHQVDVLHGDMSVVERADTIIRFKRGDFKVLITTNVFARGIDVAQVSVVINYDLPIKYNDQGSPMVVDGYTQPDCETYLHRIGRTGRFGKTGIAINLIDSEDSMNMINVLENHFQMKIAKMDPSNICELEAIEMA